jgi:LysR family transcriptional regulator, low CO2-responsive transcriptional regulator
MPRPALRRYFRHGLLPQLLVFEAVARLRSVTRAAEELHLAQPTVSTQLKKLSGALGLALFEQRGRGLEPTPAGGELRAACDELIDLFERIEARLAPLRAVQPDVLRIGATPGARRLAARLVAAFCLRHPGSRSSLHVAGRDEILERLLSGKDDLCLLPGPEDWPGIATTPVAVESLHLYAQGGHRLAAQRSVPPEALASEGFVLREPGSGSHEALRAALSGSGIQWTAHAELPSDETVAEAIAAGLGIGMLPEGEAHALLRAGAIAVLDVRGFPLRREWRIARRRGARSPVAAELFLREAVENQDGLLAAGTAITAGQATSARLPSAPEAHARSRLSSIHFPSAGSR